MPESRLPPTCEIRNWTVFGPGYWRGALYAPADCARVPPNFRRLLGTVNPVVKIGHDKDQRLAKRLKESLGFINVGEFAAVTPKPGGRFAVTLVNVPTAVGAQVNAGRIRSGSVELIPFHADPDDPGKRIEGPIITGVSLLGEEHPAVKGLPPPRAVFADGTPVPPARDPTPWLQAMAEVMSAGFSDAYDPAPQVYRSRFGDYPLVVARFAEMVPMIDEAFLKGLGLTPDQVQQIMAMQGGGAAPGGGMPPAAPPPPPAGGDAPPGGGMPPIAAGGPPVPPPPGGDDERDKANLSQDDQTMMSAKFATMFADVTKRLGAMEAKMSDAATAAQMSAFADRVEMVLRANARRVPPNIRDDVRADGLRALTTKCFGSVTDDAEKAFARWKLSVETRPESQAFSEPPPADAPKAPDGKPLVRLASPVGHALIREGGFLDRHVGMKDVRARVAN